MQSQISLCCYPLRDTRIFARMLVIFFVFPVMCIGATRFTAPDYRIYARLYEQGGVDIFDPIFYSLMQVSSSFGLPLQGFLFLIFSVNIFLYWRVSKYFSVILMSFWLLSSTPFCHARLISYSGRTRCCTYPLRLYEIKFQILCIVLSRSRYSIFIYFSHCGIALFPFSWKQTNWF